MDNETQNKKTLPIIGIIIIILILIIALISNKTEKFDLAEQLSLGQKYLQELNYEQAILTFSKIIEIEPMSVEAYNGLAQTYEAIGDIDNLIATLEKGVSMTGDIGLYDWLDELLELNIVINWVDTNVEVGVRNILNKPTGDIKVLDLLDITTIKIVGDQIFSDTTEDLIDIYDDYLVSYDTERSSYIPYYSINDIKYYLTSYIEYLDDFEHFPNLVDLQINFNEISDISSIVKLTNLKNLDLSYNDISDISPIAELTNLTSLNLGNFRFSGNIIGGNDISDISPLARLNDLVKLSVPGNNISDFSPIVELMNLEYLCLSNNNISDLYPCSNLINLNYLDVSSNNISNIAQLSELTNLNYLDISTNNIGNISPIAQLTNLTYLNSINNNINDISPIVGLINLNLLYLSLNNINDITHIAPLINLTSLFLDFNSISDITPLANLNNLTLLGLNSNNITDWSPVDYVETVHGRP